ncbi:N-acetylneuraminate synthase family protein [Runella slithyformis]|uniref:N-acetylneuraminate synthase n=1 Tax=Runella slithyformis (strain ATCC 29530 / DSM 19594 / LMG 11500 / NCIMB 11436 / LSU 4) TaxID=761193 RepID=A0A7U4E7U6_RUNSL|nr:N-acetylneuraminate synthase family protein [Runella slithyformis]AEI51018.1 N-acetylneuraminate synthase [Runella slithyformis DSM 19594]
MESFSTQIKNIFSKSKTDRVYVLGKGSSLGKIAKSRLEDGVVININDSERYYAGDIALVHSLWAYQSIKDNGFKAGCYISDKQMPESINSLQVPYSPDTYETTESYLFSAHGDELFISDFLFLSAIRLGVVMAKELNKKLDIYFLGFDFGSDSNTTLIQDFSGHSQQFRDAVLRTQEDTFIRIKSYIEAEVPSINLIHVGRKPYSDISIGLFNQGNFIDFVEHKSNNELYLSVKDKILAGIPMIVAELTNNHIGDEKRLRTMIRMAKDEGADIIKVQRRDVNTFYSEAELMRPYISPFGNTLGHYRRAVELTDDLFKVLIDECRKNEIFWFTSVLDKNSYDYILQYNLPLIKLPSTISNHRNYLKHVAETFDGDIVVSTGFTDKEYEDFVLNQFTSNNRLLYLLQCTSSYPAPPDACNIAVIRHYSEIRHERFPNIIPGYSSHDVGALASQMAISAGALMIEKHVKLGNLDWVHFDSVALDISKGELKSFIEEVRKAAVICGEKEKKIHIKEHHKYVPNKMNN